jgi:hypothetical protein
MTHTAIQQTRIQAWQHACAALVNEIRAKLSFVGVSVRMLVDRSFRVVFG